MLIVRRIEALPGAAETGLPFVLACECRPLARGPALARPAIKLMRRGREEHVLRNRRVTLDEDAYLILNGDEPCASVYDGDGATVRAFVVFLDPVPRAEGGQRFSEHLRPLDDEVGACLLRLADRIDAGEPDTAWFDEQLAQLLTAATEREHAWQHAAHRIDSVKPATRDELLRRVLLAADFICSNYHEPITLDDIAEAARLSRFHLVRLFRKVHGVTPHAYLTRKRLTVAERLMARTGSDLNQIALAAGLGTRWSLFRQLRKRRGAGGEALRSQWRGEGIDARSTPPCTASA